MIKRVLVIGGYGNFGAHIVHRLSEDADIQVIVSGRSLDKCKEAAALHCQSSQNRPEAFVLDAAGRGLVAALQQARPDVVIHTSGPFQGQGYDVARACIDFGCHYVDLADGRAFVSGIGELDAAARQKGVTVISGASSVPCLTAAVIDHHLPYFLRLEAVDYGITTAQRTNTGLATTAAVLGYAGKPFTTLRDGKMQVVYGWQGLVARRYPELGWRLLGNCDIPDLSIFPERYPDLKTMRFRAGIEIPGVHLGLWGLSLLVRAGLISSLAPYAAGLLRASRFLDRIGSDRSAFHMEMSGTGRKGRPVQRRFFLVARSGHGPFIPATPAILCARMLVHGQIERRGAFPCVGLITLEDYLEGLSGLDITPMTEESEDTDCPRS